jgi:two-component system, OmpR family, alkaline phosphatase synthesis response regulator PhoP
MSDEKNKDSLVIEDELDILEIIEYNLSKEGFEVCSALDGEEG